jgi:hypothetical protein
MLHPLEIEALKEIAKAAGGDPEKVENSIIDHRLSFDQNKRVVREWLKAEGKAVDMRSEMVAEKELQTKMTEALQAEIEHKEAVKYSAVVGKKEDINRKIKGIRLDIIKEITEYNPYMENVTYATLFACMNGKIGKQKTNVINMGKHGIGKSRSTSDLLTKLEITDAVIVRGFMTPKKVYETLKQNFCSIVCFDEAENIMNDEMAMFILRPAMFGGTVSWLSMKGDAIDTFDFKGTIIANMNHFGVTEAAAAPLFDRTLFNSTNLDNKHIIEKIQSAQGYKMNEEVWRVIKDKITLIRNEGIEELTPDEEKYVMKNIVKVANNATVFNKSLSARARSRAFLVARCMKSLFLELDSTVLEVYEKIVKPYISTDDADDICVRILTQKPDLTRKQLTEIIAEQKQISERQATRMVSAAIERGILMGVNRSKVVVNSGGVAK